MRPLRPATLALAASLALVTGARAARAAHVEPQVEPREVHVEAAVHRGEIVGSTLAWRSRLLLDVRGAETPAPGGSWAVRLAVPLPAGETLTGPEGVSAVVEGGRVVGLRVDPRAVSRRVLSIALTQTLDHAHAPRSNLHLGAPLAAGDAVQIVDVIGVGGDVGAQFEPDPALGLDRHVGYFAPRGLDAAARDGCEKSLDYRRKLGDNPPLYVRAGGAITTRGGLDGALLTRAERTRGGILGAGVAFAAIVAALLGARSRLSRAVREEEADAALAAEFERLEATPAAASGSASAAASTRTSAR